jgi:hypothetical protein
MWGGHTPSPEQINQLTNAFVAEWSYALGQMLRHWDQPPTRWVCESGWEELGGVWLMNFDGITGAVGCIFVRSPPFLFMLFSFGLSFLHVMPSISGASLVLHVRALQACGIDLAFFLSVLSFLQDLDARVGMAGTADHLQSP